VGQYALRRIALLVPVLVGVSLIVFFILRIIPGDVARLMLGDQATPEDLTSLRHSMGLDRPLWEQYLTWVGNIPRGDMGTSIWTKRTVLEEFSNSLPVTLELAAMAVLVAVCFGAPLGVLSAIRQDTWIDYVSRLLSISGLAMPGFWLGTLLLLIPSLLFQWVPPLVYEPFTRDPLTNLQQFFLPALALGVSMAALIARLMRSSLLEVMRQDYMRTAWAKGLQERAGITRHALKNAAIPVVTLVGNQFGHFLGGAVIMETIFSLPGVGRLTVDAIHQRDFVLVQGAVLLLALLFTVINLLVDLTYGYLDPRIRYQ